MNPDIKAAWVAALRSGEYKQGRDVLRDTSDRFCCLGVLCDLHSKATGTEWGRFSSSSYEYDGSEGLLTKTVVEWAGFSSDVAYFDNPTPPDDVDVNIRIPGQYVNDRPVLLTNLNDFHRKSFDEIADLIEAGIPVNTQS